jgi:hypothetical protein
MNSVLYSHYSSISSDELWCKHGVTVNLPLPNNFIIPEGAETLGIAVTVESMVRNGIMCIAFTATFSSLHFNYLTLSSLHSTFCLSYLNLFSL